MTISPMVLVTVCGPSAEKDGTLDALQELGALHLLPLRAPEPLTPEDPEGRRRADTAFSHLMDCPEQLTPWPAAKPLDADAVIGGVIENRVALRRMNDRRDELDALIDVLEPWGDFALPEASALRGQRIWLFEVPIKDRQALDALTLPWALVGGTRTALHVAVISPEAPPSGLLPNPPIDTGGATLSALVAERDDLAIEIETTERKRADLTRWRLALGARLAAAEDADDRREAAGQTLDAAKVFAVQGWAPADAAPALQAMAGDRRLALLMAPPTLDDQPPTLLRSEEDNTAMGGDLTRFYMSPGYRSWDPSIIVFVSFAIFFAMILADAGYALLIGALTLLYTKKLGASATGRRIRALLVALSVASFAYGVAAGSYFGFAPPSDGWRARLVVVDVTDFEAMMRVSILLGAAHISLALAAVMWINGVSGKSLTALGWLLVIVGGLGLWLGGASASEIGARVVVAAPWVLGSGLVAVLMGGFLAQPRTSGTGARLGVAVLGLTGITKLFGDLLSYLRLFALGLASASLAGTFNQLAMDIHAGQPGIGLLFAILVLLFGHGINLIIGLMSGVVHGLRLNYIEFFGWGLPDEGYPFRPFAKRETTA